MALSQLAIKSELLLHRQFICVACGRRRAENNGRTAGVCVRSACCLQSIKGTKGSVPERRFGLAAILVVLPLGITHTHTKKEGAVRGRRPNQQMSDDKHSAERQQEQQQQKQLLSRNDSLPYINAWYVLTSIPFSLLRLNNTDSLALMWKPFFGIF